jgi:transcriptional regulator with XRE-family HTH domain
VGRQRLPSLNARIRTKRSQLGLTGAELAQRADISPSYVSLIEKGAKVPDERVAARIARALRDDEDLYRAWAQASRVGLDGLNLVSRMEAISRSPDHLKAVERGEMLPPEALFAEPEQEALEMMTLAPVEPDRDLGRDGPAPSTSGPDVLRVPVLAERADPGRLAPSPLAVENHLLVDQRLVAEHPVERLFAYEVTERDMKHLRGVAAPGDRIVFRRGGRVSPDRVCAVRTPAGVVLSRVLFKGRSLLLLPGEGERDFESVDVEGLTALPGIVAGTHVLLIRR